MVEITESINMIDIYVVDIGKESQIEMLLEAKDTVEKEECTNVRNS